MRAVLWSGTSCRRGHLSRLLLVSHSLLRLTENVSGYCRNLGSLDAGLVEEALLCPETSSALSTWAGAPPLSAVWLAELKHCSLAEVRGPGLVLVVWPDRTSVLHPVR